MEHGRCRFSNRTSRRSAAVVADCEVRDLTVVYTPAYRKHPTMLVDEHRHIGYCRSNGTRTAARIMAELDRLGFDRAIVVPSGYADAGPVSEAQEAVLLQECNAVLLEYLRTGQVSAALRALRERAVDHALMLAAVQDHAPRLRGCWWVNPWEGDAGLAAAAAAVAAGMCCCFKVHPLFHGFAADEPVLAPVLALAADLGVPVWFHSAFGPGTEIERVAQSARRAPQTTVVLGHAGVGDPDGSRNARAAAETAAALANVWIDLSDCREPALRTIFRSAPRERLLLASDDPFGALETQLRRLEPILGGDDALRRAVCGENARRLFRERL